MAAELHHRVDGPVGASVVVLSHAIGTNLSIWDAQADELARDWRVIRYDHRGHGRSPVPDGPYSIADLGSDLIALLDRLDVERASLCGLSLGAMTALWVAANVPDRVERVVACSVIARPASPASWADRAATVRRDGLGAIADMVVERWGYRARRPDAGEVVRSLLLATPPEGYAATCDAIERLDLWPDLGHVAAPTLVVAGADDPAAPESEARAIASALPDARVTVVEQAGHLVSVERPAELLAAISGHLAPIRGASDDRSLPATAGPGRFARSRRRSRPGGGVKGRRT
jgi:3-oxoadipate enol-lactonase